MSSTLRRRNRLLTRMMLALLPAGAVPLVVFGWLAIRSHYDSLRARSLDHHRAFASFMGSQLEDVVATALQQLSVAADNEVYKTENLFQIREALAAWHAFSPEVVKLTFVGRDGRIIATEPLAPEVEGKHYADLELHDFRDDGFKIGAIYIDASGFPRFPAARRVLALDRSELGFLVADVSLARWARVARATLKNEPDVLAALLPTDGDTVAVRIDDQMPNEIWKQSVVAIGGAGPNALEPDVRGERYQVTRTDLPSLRMRLIVAQPQSSIYAAPRRIVASYVGLVTLLLGAMGSFLFALARSITRRVDAVVDAASSFGDGRLEVRAPVTGSDEVALLAETFNRMGDALQGTHQRMRVMYKSVMELFACNDVDQLLKKGVELTCTQCQGDAAWFVPTKHGRRVDYADADVFVGLHCWLWKNHRVSEIPPREAASAWKRADGDRIFTFTIKAQGQELGVLKVAYRGNPDEFTVSLLHALVSLVETAVGKQELLRRGAVVTTELEMAEAVQRNVMSDNMLVSKRSRVAYHYRPASRLGGDWFYLVEDQSSDRLYAIMGDVTGHGLPQGLVTTAVKGALDVIETFVKRTGHELVDGPAAIVSLLETVVTRVAGPNSLSMTCLVAEVDFKRWRLRVCNAGHTFPILLREEDGINVARHLHKNQQPMLGHPTRDPEATHFFTEGTYDLEPHDLLVIYTDGLTEAKNLKPGIFGRFMMRGLRKRRQYGTPDDLRDEILAMFNYYTQGTRIDDDVCFLVVQMPEDEGREQRRRERGARSA